MNNETNNRNKWLIMILGFIIGFAIGITISYFSHYVTSNPQMVTTGNIEVVYENENVVKLNNNYPIKDSDIINEATKIDFSIRNKGKSKSYVWINIIDISMSDTLKNDSLKWSIYEGNTQILQSNFLNVDSNNTVNLIKNTELNSDDSKNYSLYIWISENKMDQSLMMSNQFKGKIEVLGYDKYR